jgi:threonine/homoserine/homoserine lactone efflux protein
VKLALLFSLAFATGFVAAIPVGGSQIEMAKRVLAGERLAGLMVVLGSVTSDMVYGIVALFGIAPFMEIRWVLGTFMALGAVLLWVLAWLTLKESTAPRDSWSGRQTMNGKRRSFATGFSLAFSNPPMIMTWLLGVTLARQLGLAEPFTAFAKSAFIAGGALGLGGYLGVLGVIIHRIKHVVPMHALGSVYRWLGITLLVLSFFFVYGAAEFFL